VGDPANVRKPNRLEINFFIVAPPSDRSRKEIIAFCPTAERRPAVPRQWVLPTRNAGGKKKVKNFPEMLSRRRP